MIEHGWFGGMHMFWWIFWVAAIVLFLAFIEAEPKHTAQQRREKPLRFCNDVGAELLRAISRLPMSGGLIRHTEMLSDFVVRAP